MNGDALEANLELSGLRNVVVSRAAVGAAPGTVAIGRHAGAESRSSGAWRRGPAPGAVEVEQITLDDYVEAHVPGRIRLVKIDVEGMEPDELAGLSRTLAAGRVDALLVELSGDAMEEPDAVLEPLRAAGLACLAARRRSAAAAGRAPRSTRG